MNRDLLPGFKSCGVCLGCTLYEGCTWTRYQGEEGTSEVELLNGEEW